MQNGMELIGAEYHSILLYKLIRTNISEYKLCFVLCGGEVFDFDMEKNLLFKKNINVWLDVQYVPIFVLLKIY